MADSDEQRLAFIATAWTLVRQAHGQGPAARTAQEALIERYSAAVHNYLRRSVGYQEDAAQDLFQEFALRFVRGDFRRADPAKGRFRDYLSRVLANLIHDHFRSRRDRPRALVHEPAASGEPAQTVEDAGGTSFIDCWKKSLLDNVWADLRRENDGYHAALASYVRNPEVQSSELSVELTERLGRPISPANVRVLLHRGRARFADLLLAEVARSLGTPSEEELVDELRQLGLYTACESALRARAGDGAA